MVDKELVRRTFWECSEHHLQCEPVMPFRTLWNCPANHWVQIYRDCDRIILPPFVNGPELHYGE